MNLEEIFSKLNPQQRGTLAQEYVNGMGGTSQQVDPNNVSPEQLAKLHEEAKQKDPTILDRVRQHPLLTGLAGGVAAYELDRHFVQKK